MIEDAIKEFGIDRVESYMVGDRASDIMCGQNAGLKTVWLESGYGKNQLNAAVKADEIHSDLEKFVHSMA